MVAKLSSQTLRGLRQVCEALNFNALNFTSVKVAKLSSQTIRKSSSFRTLRKLHELCEAFNSNNTSRFHGEQFIHDFTTTLVMHQARLILPLHLQSIGGVNRLAIFGELRILLLRAFPAPKEIRQSNDPNTPSGVQLYVSVTAR